MRPTSVRAGFGLLLGVALCWSTVAIATPVTMTFDEFAPAPEQNHVADFYNGGCTTPQFNFGNRQGTCGGPDYGVIWDGGLAGYQANLMGMPSGANVLTIPRLGTRQAIMNVAAGFAGHVGFSYYAKARRNTGSAVVYSGLDGTGSVLASFNLVDTGCGSVVYLACWDTLDLTFGGVAHSVVFSGDRRGALGIDSVRFDMDDGVPQADVVEPAGIGLFGLGLLALGVLLRRRHALAR